MSAKLMQATSEESVSSSVKKITTIIHGMMRKPRTYDFKQVFGNRNYKQNRRAKQSDHAGYPESTTRITETADVRQNEQKSSGGSVLTERSSVTCGEKRRWFRYSARRVFGSLRLEFWCCHLCVERVKVGGIIESAVEIIDSFRNLSFRNKGEIK